MAELRQELADAHNTIFQLRKNAEPYKRQRREGRQGGRRGQGQQSTKQPGPKKEVQVPEWPAKGPKPQPTSPAKVQARMLRTSKRTSDSDEELMYVRANLVRPREETKPEPMVEEKSEVLSQDDELPFDMDQIIGSRQRACPTNQIARG